MTAYEDRPAALLLAHADAAPPAELVDQLRALLPDRPVETLPLDAIRARAQDVAAQRMAVVVPYLLSSADTEGERARAATRDVAGAITTHALGPHPVLSGELGDAVRRAGLRADCGIVIVAAPPAGADAAPGERPTTSHTVPAEPDPDDLPDDELAYRRDLAQVVYDLDSVWVGPVAAALVGAQPDPVDVVRYMAADGRDVAVVQYALADLDLDTARLALVGATVVIRPGLDERRAGVVIDRYEQGLAELRAGLDEDAWSAPLV